MANHVADPFDDCFTGDELRELEFVATQAECKTKKQQSNQLPRQVFQSKQISTFSKINLKDEASTSANSKCEVQNLDKVVNEKCGEIRLLRDKVREVERLLILEKQAKMAEEKRRKDEKLLHELDLQKKVEVYQDRLEFKNTELQQAYQIIKNLEVKVRDVSKQSEKVFPKDVFEDEKLPSKKLKLVKPENPCVFIKKENLDTSQVQDITRKDTSFTKFKCQWNLSGTTGPVYTLISARHQRTFNRLLTYYVASNQPHGDLHEASRRLLQAQLSYSCMVEDATILASFALCTLTCQLSLTADWHRTIMGFCFCPSTTNCSHATIECLQIFAVLLQSVEGLCECFLVDSVISFLCQVLLDASLQSFALDAIGTLLEKSQSQHATLFFPVISVMNLNSLTCLPHEFIYKCLRHSVLVEHIVKKDNEKSFFENICTFIKLKFPTSPLIIRESLQLFLTMMGNCSLSLLHQHGCYLLIFEVVTLIMHDLLDKQENNKLLCHCMYALYFCLLSFPSCLVGRHKLSRLMLQICHFLESQPKFHWAEELKRLIHHYI